MAEILTESFCERCGTRYTFETAAPRGRGLGALGTIGRGLRNFVVMGDSSLDEAMAVARSETDQRVTTAQLEAFHRTFNFCLSCRQYTCSDCWNAVEGRCLSCAPLPEAPIVEAPAAMPDLRPAAVTPIVDAAPGMPLTTLAPETEVEPTAPLVEAPMVTDAQPATKADVEAAIEPVAESPADVTPASQPPTPAELALAFEPAATTEPVAPVEAPAAAEAEVGAAPEPEAEAAAPIEPEAEAAAPIEPLPAAAAASDEPPPAPGPAEGAPAQVALPEFLPGRSLDDEIAAYELRIAALAAPRPEPLPPVVVEATPPPARFAPAAHVDRRQVPVPEPPGPTEPAVAAAHGLAAPGTCRSCGLSLSASARFCRRCGTPQVA